MVKAVGMSIDGDAGHALAMHYIWRVLREVSALQTWFQTSPLEVEFGEND